MDLPLLNSTVDRALCINRNAGIISFNVFFPFRKKVYSGKASRIRLCFNNICHQGILYRCSFFTERSYSLKYPYLADYYFNIRALTFCQAVYIPLLLSQYDDSTGLSKQNKDYHFHKDKFSIFANYFGLHYAFLASIIYNLIRFFIWVKRALAYTVRHF